VAAALGPGAVREPPIGMAAGASAPIGDIDAQLGERGGDCCGHVERR
jgi:hypothetical protein